MKRFLVVYCLLLFQIGQAQNQPVDYVNPFIGTSNFGATHPGAIAPRGMASVSPFNVAGRPDLNSLEKDSRWLSNPYVYENSFLTGFSHVNMSGVGCPELGVIISMPTTGELQTDHLKYGSTYSSEQAQAGYYSAKLDKYGVKAEMTASTRTGVSRYSFPKGKSNILLNLGLGLTNEQGAMVKIVSPTEIEGMRTVGSFCYNNPEAAYPVYFVAEFSKPADDSGVWKTPYKYEGEESQWMTYNGETRIKKGFRREVVGDSIGAYFTYNFDRPTSVEMKIGISYVSIENARENLKEETEEKDFDKVYEETRAAWEDKLSVVEVEGSNEEDKYVFYTSLYHMQIHPNIFNDVNGEYPEISTGKIGKTNGTRYTTFSLWDTYRNYHQLLSLLYPEEQLEMVNSILEIYDENGWLPKWELNATETFTMVGDPAAVILSDTYLRGLTDFNIEKAYQAMLKSATQTENNPLRPGLKEYIQNGFVSVDSGVAGPVSVTQEYNMADFAIAQLAKELGKEEDYQKFIKRSLSYRKLFNPESQFLQPKHEDGRWMEGFDPLAGANFTKNPGFIEGNAWQYLFMLSHDAEGLIDLMGGEKEYEEKLDAVFEQGHFDMANEPDFAYPYLYNFISGNENKAYTRVKQLLNKYYKNTPDGLPGNDDTGTMSAWAVYSMMGFYPLIPAESMYAITAPAFEAIKINLNPDFYGKESLIIRKEEIKNPKGKSLQIIRDNEQFDDFFISHKELINSNELLFHTTE